MSEYPKMLFRDGRSVEHNHLNEPLKLQGQYEAETRIVDSADEEAAARDDGWRLSLDGSTPPSSADALENERLRARVAELEATQRPRMGRPPKVRPDMMEATDGDA